VGWVVTPGTWVADRAQSLWRHYIYLVGVREQNRELAAELDDLARGLARYKERAAEVERLRSLMSFGDPPRWQSVGARVIAHRMGPNAALDTIVVDKGRLDGVDENTPVVTHRGVVGRILRTGSTVSTVILLTDRNSRIAVLGQTHRTTGVLAGRGSEEPLEVLYVPLNTPIEEGELLVTSGLAGIFPKGLPVARIVSVQSSRISLFQVVRAELLVDPKNLEELLLLRPEAGQPPAARVPEGVGRPAGQVAAANATREAGAE
jgi:rod shape-determining protein MreC